MDGKMVGIVVALLAGCVCFYLINRKVSND